MPASRQQLIAAIHIGKNKLALDDDTYRDMLAHVTGKRSAKDLSMKQLNDVIKHLDSLGFKKSPNPNKGKKPDVAQAKQALIKKIEAILVEQKLSWNYVKGMAKKMFDKEALEFCTERQLWKIVAALEYHVKRQNT